MMSFSDNLKSKICTDIPTKKCCRLSLLRGMLLFLKNEKDGVVSFKSKSENTVCLFADLLFINFGIEGEFSFPGVFYYYRISDFNDIDIINKFLKSVPTICNKCEGNFVKGAFLASGSIMSPEKGFRVDISVYDKEFGDILAGICSEHDINPSYNKSCNRIYFKGNTKVSDFLSFIGAKDEFYDFINRGIINKMKQDAGRINNFELANLKRSSKSFSSLSKKLSNSDDEKLKRVLNDQLYESAILKKENPELSLADLVDLHKGKISKSGLYHRLKKISELL